MKTLFVLMLAVVFNPFANVSNKDQKRYAKAYEDARIKKYVGEQLYKVSDSLYHVVNVNYDLLALKDRRIDSIRTFNTTVPQTN